MCFLVDLKKMTENDANEASTCPTYSEEGNYVFSGGSCAVMSKFTTGNLHFDFCSLCAICFILSY